MKLGKQNVNYLDATPLPPTVETENGPKVIEQIEIGDRVWALDPKTGEIRLCEVRHVFVHEVDHLVMIEVDGETIQTTPEHPFWVADNGWMKASKLTPGDALTSLLDESFMVSRVQQVSGSMIVYNLEVSDLHTYFVSSKKILVHNKPAKYNPKPSPPENGGNGLGNPFKGKTAAEIDEMFKAKGFEPRGPDPLNGKGGYVNPKTGRSYHIDEANSFGEPPHVDVNRPKTYDGPLDKKKYPFKK